MYIAPRDEQCVLGSCPGRNGWGGLSPLGWHLIGLLSAFGCLSLHSLPSLFATVSMSLSTSLFHPLFLSSSSPSSTSSALNTLWLHLLQPCRLSLSLSLSLSLFVRPSHSSLPPNLRNSRGIDWWSQPLVSPPSSNLLFTHTLTH